jgi:hypothetical protein
MSTHFESRHNYKYGGICWSVFWYAKSDLFFWVDQFLRDIAGYTRHGNLSARIRDQYTRVIDLHTMVRANEHCHAAF